MKWKKAFQKSLTPWTIKYWLENWKNMDGINHQYIDWVKSYLNSWKQYVCYPEVTLLSLIFVGNFQHVTNFLNLIMFAVETNIFYSNRNINELFEKVNKEQANVTNWCVTNKLSNNASKINS